MKTFTRLTIFLFLLSYVTFFGAPKQVLAQAKPSDSYQQWINDMGLKAAMNTPTGIISLLLPILFTFAGLILFGMLIAGGYQMLFSAGDPKSADAGKQRITFALVGFLVVFASYWLTQIIQIIFGVNIL